MSVNPEYTPIGSVWSWDQFAPNDIPEDISYEIVRSKVKILYSKLLGKGEFGNVYEGLLFAHDPSGQVTGGSMINLRNGFGQNACMRVAIKQLRDNAKELDKERFITEAKFMR